MLNNVVLVGRLIETPCLETKDGKSFAKATIKVPRNFKNEQGEYDVDYIDIYLYNDLAKNACDYCEKEDIIGVKGRIQVNSGGENHPDYPKETIIIAEKITYLSSNKTKKD